MSSILFISAGAGSGKTYRLTEYLQNKLDSGEARPEGVVATTFTKKAANELVQRVRQRLVENGKINLSNSMGQSLIGTVNSVCARLLERYAFEAGLSPELQIIDEDEGEMLFSQALEQVLSLDEVRNMNILNHRLSQEDWRKEIRAMVNLARANDISSEDLTSLAEESIHGLLLFFPKPVERDLNAELQRALTKALEKLPVDGDTTKKTNDYVVFVRSCLLHLQQSRLSWANWVKLSKERPAVRSQKLAEPIWHIASLVESHPVLHTDIENWISSIFSLAGRSMKSYQEFKALRGLMDFIDQEKLVLQLLDNPAVVSALTDELDLLLVDEFQDTSPIQLAVFLKLAEFATQTGWVGDIKQAIYGFRGSDPELMNAVVRGLENANADFEVLPSSWRSRPPLVHLVNDLFVPAFADILDKEKVVLSPAVEEKSDQTALEYWRLNGSNQGKRSAAMAEGVMQLLSEDRQVIDKNTKNLRPLHPGDVAILSRTHVKAAGYAQALVSRGITVSLSAEGLLVTPEAKMAIACLRYLIDPSDSLATAEIISLQESSSPEQWLQDRLEHIEKGLPSAQWGVAGTLQNKALVALNKERGQMSRLSPSEALETALQAGEVERTVKSWGPSQERSRQRLANIEALRGLATEYEELCLKQHSAATAAGFVIWLGPLATAKLDKKGRDDKIEAVQVLTHHAAKGLEWPVVICADLDSNLRPGYWGLSAISDEEEVDFEKPLAGRNLRYWVKPFGRQSSQINVYDQIDASELAAVDYRIQLAEAKRLLYVSMTRARDLLILPLKGKGKHPWLETLEAEWLLDPKENFLTLPNGEQIACRELELTAPDDIALPPEEDEFTWFESRLESTPKISAVFKPSSAEVVSKAAIGEIKQINSRLTLRGNPEMNKVGDALHYILAAYLSTPPISDAEEMGTGVLERYELNPYMETSEIITAAETLQSILLNDFKTINIYPEWPIQLVQDNGQLLKGWIDLAVETNEGWIIIDHKSFPGNQIQMQEKALEYSGQLLAYRKALESASSKSVIGQWINFVIGGYLVEVVW